LLGNPSVPLDTAAANLWRKINKHVYDESKIKTLSRWNTSGCAPACTLAGLVMARTMTNGCYILLKEVVDNANRRVHHGHGKEVQIEIKERSVSVRDFGRGIYRLAKSSIVFQD